MFDRFIMGLSVRADGSTSTEFRKLEYSSGRAFHNIENQATRAGAVVASRMRSAAASAAIFQGPLGGFAGRLSASAALFETVGGKLAGTLSAIAGSAVLVSAGANLQNYQQLLRSATKTEADYRQAQAATLRIARETRSGLTDTIRAYARLKLNTSELGLTSRELEGVLGTVQKAIQLSGAGASESAAAMQQFAQALGNDRLAGDEFKSLGENASKVLRTIAQGIKEIGAIPGFDGSIASLRELGSEGKITADVIVRAVQQMSGQVDADFAKMGVTLSQSGTLFRNAVSAKALGIEDTVHILSGTAQVITFVADNFDVLSNGAAIAGIAIAGKFAGPMLRAGKIMAGFEARIVANQLGLNGLGAALGQTSISARRFGLSAQAAGTMERRMALAVAAGRPGLIAWAGAANVATGAAARLRAAGASLLNVFGGSWGAALTAATGLLFLLSQRTSDAERAAGLLGISQEELRRRYLGANGAIGAQNALLKENAQLAARQNVAEARDLQGDVRKRLALFIEGIGAQGDPRATSQFTILAEQVRNGAIEADAALAKVDELSREYGLALGTLRDRVVREAGLLQAASDALGKQLRDQAQLIEDAQNQRLNTNGITLASVGFGIARNDQGKPLTVQQINAEAAATAKAAGTLAAATARYKKAKADLKAAFKDDIKGGVFTDPARAADYAARLQQIESAFESEKTAIKEQAKATREASKAQKDLVADLNAVIDALDPAASAARRYAEQLGAISRARKAGLLGADVNLTDADRRLAEGPISDPDTRRRLLEMKLSIANEKQIREQTIGETSEQFQDAVSTAITAGGATGTAALSDGLSRAANQFGSDITTALQDVSDALGFGRQARGLISLFSQGPRGLDTPGENGLSTRQIVDAGIGTLPQQIAVGLDDVFGELRDALDDVVGSLDKAFGANGQLGRLFGQAMGHVAIGSETGKLADSLLDAVGAKSSKLGAQIGGSIGSAIAGPLGAAVGSVIGGLAGGALKSTKRGSATIISVDGGISTRGNSKEREGAAADLAGSIQDGLRQIADRLGGELGAFRVSIGIRDKNFRVDPTGRGITKTKNGAIDFGQDEEAAVRFALLGAIKDGAVKGISEGAQRLLQAGRDLDRALDKAIRFDDVFKRLKAFKDPVGAAIDNINEEFEELKQIFFEAGASTEQFAQLEELYNLERADAVKQALSETSSALHDFLDSLNFSEDSGLSLRERRVNALDRFNPFVADIMAGKKVDSQEFTEVAQSLLEIERDLFGSTQGYFDRLKQITDLTSKAIGTQENVVSIGEAIRSPFDSPSGTDVSGVESGIRDGNRLQQIYGEAITAGLGEINRTLRGMTGDSSGGGGGGTWFETSPRLKLKKF